MEIMMSAQSLGLYTNPSRERHTVTLSRLHIFTMMHESIYRSSSKIGPDQNIYETEFLIY